MARNQVQFQKGLSLTKFLDEYGTEVQCHQALCQWKWPDGFQCPHCGHTNCCKVSTRKLYQCSQCHHQTSVTSGSIFAATRLPLTTWFLGISGDSKQKWHLCIGIDAAIGDYIQCGLADEA
jgi:ribosomal protein L37AE/L43A